MTAGIGAILLVAIASLVAYTGRSFAAIANYADLDKASRNALDLMSQQIRQTNKLKTGTDTRLVFEDYDGNPLTYNYDAAHQQLTRTKGGNSETLLTGCDSLKFSIFQRTPSNNTFLPYPTSNVTNTKVIELTWNCTRSCLSTKANTESMESAKIVIRKK